MRYRGAQYKTLGYFFNGRNAMRTFDGALYTLCGINGPGTSFGRFTPSISSGAGGVLLGRYRYFVQPCNSKHFNPRGRPVVGIPSRISPEYNAVNATVTVQNIPSTHADPQVDYWLIYRSKAGTFNDGSAPEGQDFYYVDRVPMGTTSYNDNTPDANLPQQDTLRFNQNIPMTFKQGVIFGDRMFGFGFDPIATGTVSKATNTITFKSRTSNVNLITTSGAHGYAVGQYVTVVTGSIDLQFDGCYQVKTTPSGTTFTYDKDGADIGNTAETGTVEVLNFTSVTIPDGVVGCWFKAATDTAGNQYRIYGVNSASQVAIDRGFSGALAGAAFYIYRDAWEILISEFEDMQAWGPDGYGVVYKREVPGRDPAVCGLVWNGMLLVFSTQNIYAITGKDPDITNVQISAEPVYKGLGTVGTDAVDTVEGEIYFLDRQGPAVLAGGAAPQLMGKNLLTDWITNLNATDLGLAVVGCDGRYVYFSVPKTTGDSENGKSFRYDRYLDAWNEERFMHPSGYVHDDGDNGTPGLFFMQGGSLFQPNSGTTDVVAQVYSGAATSGDTLSLADTGAVFPTASGGMVEAYVHLWDATGAYQGSRRIATNTGTGLTWASTGAGGGALGSPVAAGWTYKIGIIWWYWVTKKYQSPTKDKRDLNAYVLFDGYPAPGAAVTGSVTATEIIDGQQAANSQTVSNDEPQKPLDLNARNADLQLRIESQDGAVIRGVGIDSAVKAATK